MTNWELEILVKKNKDYNDSFKNNPWFNKAIMALLTNKEEVTIEDMLDMIHRLTTLMNNKPG